MQDVVRERAGPPAAWRRPRVFRIVTQRFEQFGIGRVAVSLGDLVGVAAEIPARSEDPGDHAQPGMSVRQRDVGDDLTHPPPSQSDGCAHCSGSVRRGRSASRRRSAKVSVRSSSSVRVIGGLLTGDLVAGDKSYGRSHHRSALGGGDGSCATMSRIGQRLRPRGERLTRVANEGRTSWPSI